MERIKQTQGGLVDLDDLESKLQAHCQTHELILGCFSAASNVTGIITDTKPVAALLHHYGALSFWDYATAGELTKRMREYLMKKNMIQPLLVSI